MPEKTSGPQFKYLFTPLKIGSITVRNRIVCCGHGLRLGEGFLPSERNTYYHREKAKGGAGLQIFEACSVHPSSGRGRVGSVSNWDDRVISYWAMVARAVHEFGGRIFGQVYHAGRMARPDDDPYPIVAPSPTPIDVSYGQVPHEMEIELIAEIVEAFGQGAKRIKEAGMDGVEIHAWEGSLIQQFMSPLTNHRTDKYGGGLENRLRLCLEVLERARKYVGSEFVVGIIMNGSEFAEGGLGIVDVQEIAHRLEQTGMINYISINAGDLSDFLGFAQHVPDMSIRPAPWAYLAGEVKKVVKIPVFATGRINHPMVAENILAAGQADMVGMVRALIADPHLPNKAREGRIEDIRLCVGALEGCHPTLERYSPRITCIQNPVAGREWFWADMDRASTGKKVLVVGGGPAGMEAARVAALRGHKVTLLEKDNKLGGQVLVAAKAPHRQELGQVVSYLANQIAKAGVEIRLGIEATSELLLELNPDAIIIATGAKPGVSGVPGADSRRVVPAWNVLEGKAEVGQRVVVADEVGDIIGFSTAEYLAHQGKRAELITSRHYPGDRINPTTWRFTYQRLLEMGVILTPMTRLKEIRDGRVVTYNTFTKSERVIEGVDTIVLSLYRKANDGLYKGLKGKVRELHMIGDAVAPRGIKEATYEGHKIGRLL